MENCRVCGFKEKMEKVNGKNYCEMCVFWYDVDEDFDTTLEENLCPTENPNPSQNLNPDPAGEDDGTGSWSE